MILPWISAVIIVSILKGTHEADSVTQTEGSVIIPQGHPVRLNCTYQFSLATNVDPFWYVQFPNQPPRLFLRDLGRENSDEGIRKGFDATHEKKHKSFHLWKPASELSDSGTYYCTAKVWRSRDWIHLWGWNPDLEKSKGSIYHVKSQTENYSACIITDFSPGNIRAGDPEDGLKETNGSIVQVKNPDSGKMEASYGIVLWKDQRNFNCRAENEMGNATLDKSAEEGDTCKIMELDDNFETDEKLNFLSFTLLGLRIVFVKGVAVNLLLTVWLWKS